MESSHDSLSSALIKLPLTFTLFSKTNCSSLQHVDKAVSVLSLKCQCASACIRLCVCVFILCKVDFLLPREKWSTILLSSTASTLILTRHFSLSPGFHVKQRHKLTCKQALNLSVSSCFLIIAVSFYTIFYIFYKNLLFVPNLSYVINAPAKPVVATVVFKSPIVLTDTLSFRLWSVLFVFCVYYSALCVIQFDSVFPSAHHGPKSSRRCGSLPGISRGRQWTHRLSEGKGKPGGQTPREDVSGMRQGFTDLTWHFFFLHTWHLSKRTIWQLHGWTICFFCDAVLLSRWWENGKRRRDRLRTFHVLTRKLSSR